MLELDSSKFRYSTSEICLFSCAGDEVLDARSPDILTIYLSIYLSFNYRLHAQLQTVNNNNKNNFDNNFWKQYTCFVPVIRVSLLSWWPIFCCYLTFLLIFSLGWLEVLAGD